MITNFHRKKVPKEKETCKSLSIIILDSVIKECKYEQCKYEQKKIKMDNLIDYNLEKHLMSLVVNPIMVNIMMNVTNNLLKTKKVF